MSDIDKLYDPVIKANQLNPYRFVKVSGAAYNIKAYNPVCGDRYEFYADIDNDKNIHIHFHGFGCAVSKASGSVLTKTLDGVRVEEAIQLTNDFLDVLAGKETSGKVPDEFYAFAAVRDFPARYECAAMVWVEMKKFLVKFVP